MHEIGEGCTFFFSHLRLLLNSFLCGGREAKSHERGKTRPEESAMARIWGVEVRPVSKCLMTTILGAAATTSSCCLFRENEFSTQAGLLSLSSGPHHKQIWFQPIFHFSSYSVPVHSFVTVCSSAVFFILFFFWPPKKSYMRHPKKGTTPQRHPKKAT